MLGFSSKSSNGANGFVVLSNEELSLRLVNSSKLANCLFAFLAEFATLFMYFDVACAM